MKCSRIKCANVAANIKTGLCNSHYEHVPHGYIDAQPALQRYALLKRRGLSERRIATLSGVNRDTLRQLGSWGGGRVEVDTERKLLAVPIPARIVDGGAKHVSPVGTCRRIRALMVAGHTQTQIGQHFGITPQSVASWLVRDHVAASTAAAVADLFDWLQLVPGDSEITARRAKQAGYPPAMAWDEETIDDPDAQPNIGVHIRVSAIDRISELQELGVRDFESIGQRLGIKPVSVERALDRHQQGENAA